MSGTSLHKPEENENVWHFFEVPTINLTEATEAGAWEVWEASRPLQKRNPSPYLWRDITTLWITYGWRKHSHLTLLPEDSQVVDLVCLCSCHYNLVFASVHHLRDHNRTYPTQRDSQNDLDPCQQVRRPPLHLTANWGEMSVYTTARTTARSFEIWPTW